MKQIDWSVESLHTVPHRSTPMRRPTAGRSGPAALGRSLWAGRSGPTHQHAVAHRQDAGRAGLPVDLQVQPGGLQRGHGQPGARRKVEQAAGGVALGQGYVGEAGRLVDGGPGAHLVDLHQEPAPGLWLLQRGKEKTDGMRRRRRRCFTSWLSPALCSSTP